MIFSFILLALLTAATVGIPSILLIGNQFDRQAWALVEQGARTSQTLYSIRRSGIIDLSLLIAQRPTLRQLLLEGDYKSLPNYLISLMRGAGLDMVLVCDSDEGTIAEVGEVFPLIACKVIDDPGYYIFAGEERQTVQLLSAGPIGTGLEELGHVIVGWTLDDKFAREMRDETGLEHTVLVDGRLVATSLSIEKDKFTEVARTLVSPTIAGEGTHTMFNLDGVPYYATRLHVNGDRLEAEVSLAVGEITTNRRQLIWALAGIILLVVAVGSSFGVYLSRRIGGTLAGLSEAAEAFSRGDLDTPVNVGTSVREVSLVAHALDGARSDLRYTLDQLMNEKAWSDHLLEAIVEGIMTLDEGGRITFFSLGAEQITGWSAEEVLDRSCDNFFLPLDVSESFRELIPSPGQRRKIMVELADGKQATLAITGARLAPSEVGEAEVVLVFRDISEEEAVHRLLGHFMANVSHEFRTPLSALAASIELLIDQTSDFSPSEIHELLNSLHLGILGLQTLVDNLLESASIETGHFRVSTRQADLAEIIGEAASMMQPLLDKHEQRLVVELPAAIPVVLADPKRTVQVLVNLLSNANKFGPDQSEIFVGATVSDGWVRVVVADRGPGVSPGRRKSVFFRFSHLEPGADENQYGAGLGLSVVKAIIEAHGGDVGIDDLPEGGCMFWFTLPLVSGQ